MGAIFKREFKAYFQSIIGFLFIGCFLLLFGIFAFDYNLFRQSPSIVYALSDMLPMAAVLIPIVALNSILAEYKNGTYKLLYSLPLSSAQIFWGKYLALILVVAIPTAAVALFPFVLNFFGDINFAASFGSLVGFFFFELALTTMYFFISSISKKMTAAAVVSYLVALILYVTNLLAALIPIEWIKDILSRVSLFGSFDNFLYGVFDLRGVIYYLSITAVFAILTYRSMNNKRFM